ncbi:MAG: sulfatase-like hydrolase/transferase, partial [Bryobacteraceae bacterium]|nr:sulfatase-like hydrolase/transferase [Bryobacteraceae bacterium]
GGEGPAGIWSPARNGRAGLSDYLALTREARLPGAVGGWIAYTGLIMMDRRGFLQAAAGVNALAAVERPNVLLIITDQQTHNAMSCAANPWLKTPAMDSLAERGTRFSAAYCTYPVCSPSRGSIFTGRMPHESGVRLNGQAVREGGADAGGGVPQRGLRDGLWGQMASAARV